MTSLPQTQQRNFPAQDSRRRTAPGTPEASDLARRVLPAVDPSTAFGCVDWFLYPDEAETQANRMRA